MYCKKCGNKVNDSAAFCKKCGYRFQTGDKPADVQARASAKASVRPSPVRVKPAAAEPVGAGVKPRARVNKYFVIGLAAILVVVAAVVVIIRLATANEGKKIANAVQNTFEAKSYRAELELYNASDKYGENYVLETYTKGDKKRMYAEKKIKYKYSDFDRAYLYMPEKLGDDVIIGKNEKDRYYKASPTYSVKAVEEFSDHELYESMKTRGFDKIIESVVSCDYDELLPVVKQMMVDYYSNPKDFKYMKKCEKKDDTYRFVIDFKEFINCANSDYDIVVKTKLLQELYGKDPNKIKPEMVIKITLDGNYVSKIESRINISGAVLAKLDLKISNVNKVEYESDKIDDFLQQYDRQVNGISVESMKEEDVKTANANAKMAWVILNNSIADATLSGYTQNDVFTEGKTYCAEKSDSIYEKGAKEIANELSDSDGYPGYFVVFMVNDYYYVQWKESENSKVIGQYPDPINIEDIRSGKAVWGTYCPQN